MLSLYLVHGIHAVLRVITLALALQAMGRVGRPGSRTGSHHAVHGAGGGVRAGAGTQDGPRGQTCPRRRAGMGHTT